MNALDQHVAGKRHVHSRNVIDATAFVCEKRKGDVAVTFWEALENSKFDAA